MRTDLSEFDARCPVCGHNSPAKEWPQAEQSPGPFHGPALCIFCPACGRRWFPHQQRGRFMSKLLFEST